MKNWMALGGTPMPLLRSSRDAGLYSSSPSLPPLSSDQMT